MGAHAWCRQHAGPGDDRLVASDPHRPIRNAFWTPDGTRVLYLQDAGGDENFHLFAADPDGRGAAVDLTPYDNTLVQLQSIDLDRPDVMLISMNRRDPQLFDVYRLDPRTGEATLDTENPGGISAFADDAEMIVRAGVIQHADASAEIVVRDFAGAPWRTLARFDAADGTPELAGFTPDGASLLVITSADANAARLVRFDVATGERTDIAGDPEYDVCGGRVLAAHQSADRGVDRARTHELEGARRRVRRRFRRARGAGARRRAHRVDGSRGPHLARVVDRRRRLALVLELRPRHAPRGEDLRDAPGTGPLHARADDARSDMRRATG